MKNNYFFFKRVFDFVVAASVLLILGPVLLLICILIKTGSPGPCFYNGTRIGKNGKPFKICKFRTMVIHADKIGGSSTPENDPRITAVGKTLRRYKLDELPQFWNVLTGEMSLAGPRPQVAWAVELYTPEERALLNLRPGITDYASIKFRNEAEILKGSLDPDKDYLEKIAPEKMRLELEYLRNCSFLEDLKILFATFLAIMGKETVWVMPRPAQDAGMAK